MNCPLCESVLDTLKDKYFYTCATCAAYVKDVKFYLPIKQEKSRYEEHNNDVDDVRYQNFTSPITNLVLENHSKEQLGLDYGCGPGPVISKKLIDKGYQVKLFDPFFYPFLDFIDHQYDYIFSCEVFEHFHNPKQELEKLMQILKPDGTLYIMTHLYNQEIDFTNWYYRNDPTHVFIYTTKTIEFIANSYNLALEKLTDRLIILKKHPKLRSN